MTEPLDTSDLHHLHAAEGWFELGLHLEADRELEQIAPESRGHPDVLALRWEIYSKEQKWDDCIEIGFALVRLAPERSTSWIRRSFALHAAGRTQEALDCLLPAADKFSNVWTIPYNLACYCSVLRRFEEAQAWFKKALLVDEKTVQAAGIEDPDLAPLWDSMSTTVWKKETRGPE